MIHSSTEKDTYEVLKINATGMNAKTGYAEMRRHAGCVNPLYCSSGGHKEGVAKTVITLDTTQYIKKCISNYFLLKKKKITFKMLEDSWERHWDKSHYTG